VSWTLNGTEEGFCISSDSKTGVGIANPQRALEVAGDLVVSGTISGGAGMGSFRNRIINGDMRIAQRGTSFTTSGYTIDRWYQQNGALVVTATQNSLAAGDSPATQSGLQYFYRLATLGQQTVTDWAFAAAQQVEGLNTVDLQWGTSYGSPATVSFWYRSTIPGNHYFDISNNNFSLETYLYSVLFAVNTSAWQYYTFTIPPPPNGSSWVTTSAASLKITFMRRGNALTNKIAADFSWQAVTGANYKTFFPAGNVVNFYGQPGSIDLTGVQLEKGTVATPFEFRAFAQELALCQRYYQLYNTSGGSGVSNGILGIGHVGSATVAQFAIPLKVSMRVGPTAFSNTAVGNYALVQGGTGYAITGFSMPYSSSELVWFQTANSGTIPTVGGAVILYGANSSGFLAFSAEL
jgi:hypothetical protein